MTKEAGSPASAPRSPSPSAKQSSGWAAERLDSAPLLAALEAALRVADPASLTKGRDVREGGGGLGSLLAAVDSSLLGHGNNSKGSTSPRHLLPQQIALQASERRERRVAGGGQQPPQQKQWPFPPRKGQTVPRGYHNGGHGGAEGGRYGQAWPAALA